MEGARAQRDVVSTRDPGLPSLPRLPLVAQEDLQVLQRRATASGSFEASSASAEPARPFAPPTSFERGHHPHPSTPAQDRDSTLHFESRAAATPLLCAVAMRARATRQQHDSRVCGDRNYVLAVRVSG